MFSVPVEVFFKSFNPLILVKHFYYLLSTFLYMYHVWKTHEITGFQNNGNFQTASNNDGFQIISNNGSFQTVENTVVPNRRE